MLSVRWWDLAAIVVASVTVVLTLIEPPYGADEFGAWAATGAFLVVYFAYGRRFIDGAPVRHHLVVALLFAAVLAVGTAFEPAFAILQAFLYPFVWIDRTEPQERPRREHRPRRGHRGRLRRPARPGRHPHRASASRCCRSASASRSASGSPASPSYGEERARLLDELQAAQGQLAAMHREAGRDRRAGPARPRDPRHHRAEPHGPRDGRAAGGQPARRGRRRGRGIRARRHRAHGADGPRGAHRGARARRLAHAGRAPTPGSPRRCDGSPPSFERETGVAVTVTADAAGLDRELEVVLLRCAQEALANVRKHAKARTATIEVDVTDAGDEVVLTVTRRRRRARRRGARRAAGSDSPASATAPPWSAARSSSAPARAAARGCASSCRGRARTRREAPHDRAHPHRRRRRPPHRASRHRGPARRRRRASRSWARRPTVRRPWSSRHPSAPTSCSWTCACPASTARAPRRASWPPVRAPACSCSPRTRPTTTSSRRSRPARAATCSRRRRRRRSSPGIRAVAAGETVLAPSIAAKLVSRVRADAASVAPPALSPREREVLALVAAGRSNPEIARDALHRRGHGEDAPAARVREARRERPHPRGHPRDGARPALTPCAYPAGPAQRNGLTRRAARLRWRRGIHERSRRGAAHPDPAAVGQASGCRGRPRGEPSAHPSRRRPLLDRGSRDSPTAACSGGRSPACWP